MPHCGPVVYAVAALWECVARAAATWSAIIGGAGGGGGAARVRAKSSAAMRLRMARVSANMRALEMAARW